MGIEAPAEVKYGLIWNAIRRDNNMLNIAKMCRIAGVSRSGFYGWMKTAPAREARERQDAEDFKLIREAYNFRGYPKGARRIYMRLLHTGTRMNLKKIRRLMRKYGLKCMIRGSNAFRRMQRAMRTSDIAPNLVKREFLQHGARKILLTDITYLFYAGDRCYLSTILDAYTREVLAYKLSKEFDASFVLETVDSLLKKHRDCFLDHTAIIHSDQGCQYTSKAFIEKLRDKKFLQSMSRRGNCWDNAPQESFFGHMKDEIADLMTECQTFEQMQAVVNDWMDYYNNDRYQWELDKLAPAEYYRYIQTGQYPLPRYKKPESGLCPEPRGLSL